MAVLDKKAVHTRVISNPEVGLHLLLFLQGATDYFQRADVYSMHYSNRNKIWKERKISAPLSSNVVVTTSHEQLLQVHHHGFDLAGRISAMGTCSFPDTFIPD